MPCYNPMDWLQNAQMGGEWEVLLQPDNGGLDQFLIGDNPCVDINDCGIFRLEYCVECESCQNLKDCEIIEWNIPCCDVECLIDEDLIFCDDGVLELIVTGTGEPFTFDWTGPDGFISNIQKPNVLDSGEYSVTVTDVFGCIAECSTNVIFKTFTPNASCPI